jgi:hypothetical protein
MARMAIAQPSVYRMAKVSNGHAEHELVLTLSPAQLAETIFALGKPVVLVLEGGRPFAIPEFYAQSAAVLSTVSQMLLWFLLFVIF